MHDLGFETTPKPKHCVTTGVVLIGDLTNQG